MDRKTCTKCKEAKPIEEFYLNCYGRNGACKACVAAKNREYYLRKKGEIAEKHATRRTLGLQPDVGAVARRRATDFAVRYTERRSKANEAKKDRLQDDPAFRAKINTENALRRALKAQGALLEARVGCSADWFGEWIEYQLADGMTPENYGVVWTYDHVIPKSAFDFREPAEVERCNHWSNWRPLLRRENSIKYSKRDSDLEEAQATLACIFQLIQDNWLLRGNNA